jgi:hypothetical protein
MTDKYSGDFKQILLWCFDQQQHWYRENRGIIIPQGLMSKYPRLANRREIEELTQNEDAWDLLGSNLHLYLRQIKATRTYTPILSFSYSVTETRLRLRIALFTTLGGRTFACGFRMEAPEGIGDHHYYHVQWIRMFPDKTKALPGCPDWIPESYPAIPLDAGSPAELLLCMLLSLYGFEEFVGTYHRWSGKVATNPFRNMRLFPFLQDMVKKSATK